MVSFPQIQHEYAVKNQSSTNGIAQHVAKSSHEIDWENMKFLDSEPHWRKRKIKEALFIDCLNPQKHISNAVMNLEKGLDIPDCWKEFNADIRKIFFKKVPAKKQLLRFPVVYCSCFRFSLPFFEFVLWSSLFDEKLRERRGPKLRS